MFCFGPFVAVVAEGGKACKPLHKYLLKEETQQYVQKEAECHVKPRRILLSRTVFGQMRWLLVQVGRYLDQLVIFLVVHGRVRVGKFFRYQKLNIWKEKFK